MGGGFGLLIVMVLLVWLASGFYIVDKASAHSPALSASS